MDLYKARYETFDELYEYCYRVAGTVGMMSMPVMGLDPAYKGDYETVYKAALALGTANQLTNILRDVGEDINERNRIYVPLEELDRFGISERDVLRGMVDPATGETDDRWKAFMRFQIARAREYFQEAEDGADKVSHSRSLAQRRGEAAPCKGSSAPSALAAVRACNPLLPTVAPLSCPSQERTPVTLSPRSWPPRPGGRCGQH